MSNLSPDVEDIYELSPMQLGMLFQSLLTPGSGVFVEQQATRITSAVIPDLFEQAWQAVVNRTPVLRTSLHWEGLEKPVQVVHRHVRVKVDRLDWHNLPASASQEQLASYMRQLLERGLELTRPFIMRLALAQTSAAETWFIWHFHHALLDGWSAQLLMQEVVDQYTALISGRPYNPPQRPPFSAYIAWLQLQSEADAEKFWRSQLLGLTRPTRIGFGQTKSSTGSEGNKGEQTFALSVAESDALRAFAKASRLTLNTLVQGAWALLLSAYSGESDVVHGVVVSGRPPEMPGADAAIGLFINTLPLRIRISPREELLSWLQRIQAQQLELSRYQYSSGFQLQQWTGMPSGTRLYETVVVFENFPTAAKQTDTDAEEPVFVGRTDVAITLLVAPARSLGATLLYDHRRFEPWQIQQLTTHFATLLRRLPMLSQTQLQDIPLLLPEERQRILIDWNSTACTEFDRTSIAELLRLQATRSPEAVAFIDGNTRVSIATVHERSNQLAHYFLEQGVAHGTVVGVCCERSAEAVIVLLAIWKCRGVFLPLDPSYPRARLAYMVADANAEWVLGLDPVLAPSSRVLDWNVLFQNAAQHAKDNPPSHARPDDLAYIIYTSGSTGRPKGVAVEHRTVLNRLHWMWREYPFVPGEVGVMKTPLNFVDAFWEMLGPLLQGMPTVTAPRHVMTDPGAFVQLLADNAVTRLWFVPSLLEILLESYPDLGRRLPALRFWSSGGEPLSADLYHRFRKAVPGASLYNVFGASEIWDATVFDPDRDGPIVDCVPIGRPIANTEAYILDGQHRPVPIGVTGTLFIGGASLAHGYINQDTLTQQRFVAHPLSDVPGARLYDTGDLARFRSDGIIEYVGRRDFQLNILGFRVEPQEIESLLDAHPTVRESIVVSHRSDRGQQRLLAYVVPRNGCADARSLSAHLRTWLPSFMVPAITWVDSIPKTPSGKRDRNALPAPKINGSARASVSESANPLERHIAQQFADLLGLDTVAVDDHFFSDLGGHSLLAMRLASRLRESTGVEVSLRAIFDNPTPSGLAAVIDGSLRPQPADTETEAILAQLAALPPEESAVLLASLAAGVGTARHE
jgi:amino acid adenylation domain-containing protein